MSDVEPTPATERGCCHLFKPWINTRTPWKERQDAWCPKPAQADNDYCDEHAPLYEYLRVAE